jgi:primosomal protein N' (replication factor Y)
VTALGAPDPTAGRLYVEVALDASAPSTPRLAASPGATFHYSLPGPLADAIEVGQLVWVPFGRRELQGLVVALTATSPVERHRDILAIVEPTPWLQPADVAVARWMSGHYLAPLFDCLKPFLPPGAPGRIHMVYQRTARPVLPAEMRSEDLALLGQFGRDRELSEAEALRHGGPAARAALGRLLAAELISAQRRAEPPSLRGKTQATVRRLPLDAAEVDARLSAASWRGAEGRARAEAALALLADGETRPVAEVTQATGAEAPLLRRLATLGLIALGDAATWRDPLAGRQIQRRPPANLSSDQAAAWAQLASWLSAAPAPTPVLLHGVTGSGKTELYLRAIEAVRASGRQALVLVPEIALTPQAVERYAAGLGSERLGLLHSGLPHGQRLDTWRRARAGALDLVIGSRSAVFAPLPRLGLVVVDEEHADSYKQDASPRYDARAVALRRAAAAGALVLLGSATPSVETWHAAATGRFQRLDLPRRVLPPAGPGTVPGYSPLPPVQVVDMRTELRVGHTAIFSRPLLAALAETLAAGEQAILFLNRRGSATFVQCRDCGHVQACPRCGLPLTFHRADADLVCHHCNHREPPPAMCPRCASPRIRYFGAGTQRVEATVQEYFPAARVLRWDADTTGQRGAHEALLGRFSAGEADVLVGTQMIAKGLDLPGVTLVGVVLADTALSLPDFRAAERTFQLLAQVAGRAGRAGRTGRVLFQTYRPDDPAILAAARHDAERFYRGELAFRAEHRYPPFTHLAALEYWGRTDKAAERSATRLAERLRERIDQLGLADTDLLGPAPAFFHRVRGQVRWQLVVRGPEPGAVVSGVRLGPGWRVDVDPVSLL